MNRTKSTASPSIVPGEWLTYCTDWYNYEYFEIMHFFDAAILKEQKVMILHHLFTISHTRSCTTLLICYKIAKLLEQIKFQNEKKSFLIHIHKSCETSHPGNYRGISSI